MLFPFLCNPMRARSLDDCLNADEAMARLAAHAGYLQKLQRLFAKATPVALARACRIANFRLGVIFIHAENGAVASKLRQITPSLLEDFRANGVQVTEIRFKVQALDAALQYKYRPKPAVLGEAARASIARFSDELPDGPLRQALKRFTGPDK